MKILSMGATAFRERKIPRANISTKRLGVLRVEVLGTTLEGECCQTILVARDEKHALLQVGILKT